MLKQITAVITVLFISLSSVASDYQDAWSAISKKNYKEAKILLQKAIKNPSTSIDAYILLNYLQTYEGHEVTIPGMIEKLSQNIDKNAYLYALWFNGAALGQYSKKSSYQLNLLNNIISDKTYNGSIRSAAHYVKAMHYLYSNDINNANQEWINMGSIQDWQLTGPFENISGTGVKVANDPLTFPESSAKFTGINNVEIGWFTPSQTTRQGWLFTHAHMPVNSAVVYAQTFVESPADQDVLIDAGCNGAIKIWLNDALVISEVKERVTELDYYKNHCRLKKGYNRIMVQLGYTNNSIPNFIVRFTDEQFNPIANLNTSSQNHPYIKETTPSQVTSLKHFAEDFFEKKIASTPGNLINYILLCQTYLRDFRTAEARQVIDKALKISPENPLLKFELMLCLNKADNRTLFLQEIDWLKENDPTSYVNYQMKISNLMDEEKYAEAETELKNWTDSYGEDENILEKKASILGKLGKMDELVKLVDTIFHKYPENTSFLTMMFQVKKLVQKDSKAALDVYENYLKTNYSYGIIDQIATEYKGQGLNDKYLGLLENLYKEFSFDPSFPNALSNYYYEQRNYAKSLDYAQKTLLLAPYTGAYWKNVAVVQEQMNDKANAIASYKKAIYYDRTNYEARKKLKALEQHVDLYTLLPQKDVYASAKKANANSDYDFSYLIDDKATIIYDEGASEEYTEYAVKLYTQKGIDDWKELYLPFNSNTQTLLIEKSEVIKANGSKVPAEREDNHLVFTGLESGDAIYVKFRVQNYSTGRLGREFWDKFLFNSFVPSALARYTLILPKDYQFNSTVINSKITPSVKESNGYKVYNWELKDIQPMKSEPLMPTLNDVGAVLHLSTLKSWTDVANWYSDIAYQNMTDNFDLTGLYNEIFADAKSLTNLEKAKLIYKYIVTKIRYSSVSFRQSGLTPQPVSKIISTRLGDCKDLSTLFVALAAKAGIPAQLVLIDTRDNGQKDMVLPSMEFNHCIALTHIDGEDYYLELTDGNMPFGSLPGNLYDALALIVPAQGEKATQDIQPLKALNRTKQKIIREVLVNLNGKDEKLVVKAKRYGNLTAAWREDYASLTAEKQKESFEQFISNSYKNPVKLDNVSFTGLTDLSDSLITNYSYTVKNELIEAGSMKMIKVPFMDIIATLENFSLDKRQFPIEYWNYENVDEYQTSVIIQLPEDKKEIEIPVNENLHYKNSIYSVSYIKDGNRIKIIRSVKIDRQNITPDNYDEFKNFFSQIVDAEAKYIVFK